MHLCYRFELQDSIMDRYCGMVSFYDFFSAASLIMIDVHCFPFDSHTDIQGWVATVFYFYAAFKDYGDGSQYRINNFHEYERLDENPDGFTTLHDNMRYRSRRRQRKSQQTTQNSDAANII